MEPCFSNGCKKRLQSFYSCFVLTEFACPNSLSVMLCPSLDLLSCRHKRLVKHSSHKLFAAQYQRLTWNVQLLFRIDLKVIFDFLSAISILGVFLSWSPCALVLTGSSLGRFALSRAQRSRGAREKHDKLGRKAWSLPVQGRQDIMWPYSCPKDFQDIAIDVFCCNCHCFSHYIENILQHVTPHTDKVPDTQVTSREKSATISNFSAWFVRLFIFFLATVIFHHFWHSSWRVK